MEALAERTLYPHEIQFRGCVGMRRESRLCARPARLMGVGLSANGRTCQFDLSEAPYASCSERRVRLGIISVGKVSHEVDHTVACSLEDWHGAGAPGTTHPVLPWQTLGGTLRLRTFYKGMNLLLLTRTAIFLSCHGDGILRCRGGIGKFPRVQEDPKSPPGSDSFC